MYWSVNERMKEDKNRKIYILLTRFHGFASKAIRCFTGYRYSHTSIGLEEDMNTFYSFVYKGFIVEKITRYVKPDRKPFDCQIYEVSVTEKVYRKIKELIQSFIENKSNFKYTTFGTILCMLRVPYKRKQHYFCSYFVASILEKSEAIKLRKKSCLHLPSDFKKYENVKFCYAGNLRTMIDDFKLKPNAI